MYLSRLILNLSDPHVRRDLADCRQLHRTILSAFPEMINPDARATLGVLYRVDQWPEDGLVVIVQSAVYPDWSRLWSEYLADTAGRLIRNPAVESHHGYWESLRAGDRLRFRLRANPTKRLPANRVEASRWNGKRIVFRAEAEQIAWLIRKGEAGGFRLAQHSVTPEIKQTGDGKPASPGRLTFGSVLFAGELVITDADRFRATLRQGIGSGKAFGFGLLSIGLIPRD